VEKLVAQGPEKGKYLLVDARPAPKFMEGSIPTAINIPFVAFDKMVDKLPKDKSTLIIYYCGGVT
jgi:rhodanese-related sulfurtransferase